MLTLFRHYSLPYWAGKKAAAALCLVSIALGVAVATGIQAAGQAADRSFENTLDTLVGQATHQVTAGPAGLPNGLVAALRRVPGVQAVAPSITAYVVIPQFAPYPVLLAGTDPLADRLMRPQQSGQDLSQLPLSWFTGRSLWIPGGAPSRGLAPGQALEIVYGSHRSQLSFGGRLKAGASLPGTGDIFLADIATLQEALNRRQDVDTVYLKLEDGLPGCEAAVRAILPAGAQLQPAGSTLGQTRGMLRSYRLNLGALSLLSLLVGAFLIYSTMLFSVLARHEQMVVLRCLGLPRAGLMAWILGEAAVFGILGGLLGLGAGEALAGFFVRLNSATISDLYSYVRVDAAPLTLPAMLAGMGLGVFTSLAAAGLPAWQAGRKAPAMALREESGDLRPALRLSLWLAATLLFAGLSVALYFWPSPSPLPGFGSALFAALAATAACPALIFHFSRLLHPLFRRLGGEEAGVAATNLQAGFSRAGAALAALVLALGLNLGLRLMVQSFRQTVGQWAAQSLRADIYVRPLVQVRGGRQAPLDTAFLKELAGRPEVQEIWPMALRQAPYQGSSVTVMGVEPSSFKGRFQWVDRANTAALPEFSKGGVLVSEPFWRRYGLGRGSELDLDTARGPRRLPIAGVFRDYSSESGLVVLPLAEYRQDFKDLEIQGAAVVLRPGQDSAHVAQVWRGLYAARFALDLRDNRSLRQEINRVFDHTFSITRALEALTLLVAVLGSLATLLALYLQRQRQLAVIRALGATRWQVAAMLLWENAGLGVLAALAASLLGLALAHILIWVVNLRSFGWSIIPWYGWQPFARTLVLALFSSFLACIVPVLKAWKVKPGAAFEE